jgi:hypothetical protein
MSNESTRAHGIDFGGLLGALAGEAFPTTAEHLASEYGDYELRHAGGTEEVGTVLERVGGSFASADEVQEALVAGVEMGAVGRRRYTDRGGSTVDEPTGRPVESL